MHDWINQHPLLIVTAIALVGFAESFALIGVVVPGVVLLFSLAAVASNTGIHLAWVLGAAGLGACTGDISSFFIGRWLQHRIDRLAWFRRHRDWIEHGEWFFRRWGWLSVVIGRFVGPIRPVVPLVAGTLNMPSRLFVGLDLMSVLVWAPVYILPGYMAGEIAFLLEGRSVAERMLAYTTIIAGSVLLVVLTVHHHLHPEHPRIARWLPFVKRMPVTLPFPSLVTVLACGTALVGLILTRPLPWDPLLTAQVPAWRTTAADAFLLGFTLLGDPFILMTTGAMIALWLSLKGYTVLTLHILVVIPLAYWGAFELKDLFNVARPDWVAEKPAGASFPSGHAMGFALYLGLLSTLASEALPVMRRWQLYLPVGVSMMLMAFSRVWLGVHWLSDVLAGLLIGLLVTALIRISYVAASGKPVTLRGSAPLWLLVALTFASYWLLAWPGAQIDYQLQVPPTR